MIKPVIDRFDLMYVIRESTDKTALREYVNQKNKSWTTKIPDYYQYLKKHIKYSKQFKSVLNDESIFLIK